MSHNTDAQPHSSRLRVAQPLEPPPGKRVRTSTNSSKPACTPYPKHYTPSLLSLPDESISLIFSFLNASDTTGLFTRPRHAFALAMTNTRLLRIFGTHLTRIVPDLADHCIPTFTPSHMLNVLRIAGHSLRELNLPPPCVSLLLDLPEVCPRIETIRLQDFPDSSKWGRVRDIAFISVLPLRSLSIQTPSSRTLLKLLPVPQELFLLDVGASSDMLFALKALLLRNLPRKLYIHFCPKLPFNDDFRAYLHEICPGVEDFSLKLLCEDENEDENEDEDEEDDIARLTQLVTHLNKPRGNVRSKCRKMALEGDVFEFLEYAHMKAHVEISRWGQTCIDCGDGIYPTRIPFVSECLNQDLSRLTDIVMRYNDEPDWGNRLAGIRLKRFRVAAHGTILFSFPLQADVVEVWSEIFTDIKWCNNLHRVDWLYRASEVRLLGQWSMSNASVFFASLAKFLDQFRGKVVFLDPSCLASWTEYFCSLRGDSDKDDCILRALVMFLRRPLDNFEARGGDASTVRSLIDSIYWD